PYPELAGADAFICGTEYEIEDIHYIKLPGNSETLSSTSLSLSDENPYWIGKLGLMRDGSLRNNGIEFVTRPVDFSEALSLFKSLHK
ncbi:hypothetical protein OE165_27580, partial [Escherichia coli]|uniref:hypothetical protein n=1 Tax=Escherichia coli TaxID=562 RepID=UPI0021F26E00